MADRGRESVLVLSVRGVGIQPAQVSAARWSGLVSANRDRRTQPRGIEGRGSVIKSRGARMFLVGLFFVGPAIDIYCRMFGGDFWTIATAFWLGVVGGVLFWADGSKGEAA